MSLPTSHMESLERHLSVHEERLTQLREQLRKSPAGRDPNPKGDPNPKPPLPNTSGNYRDVLDREIRFHEKLIALARDARVSQALRDLIDDPEFAREAARDPRAAAQKRGIDLPPGLTLRLDHGADRVSLQVSSYEGLYPFMLTWDSDRGFSPVPEADVPRKRA
jgi:hypothetical protein